MDISISFDLDPNAPLGEILEKFSTDSETGLSQKEAADRLVKYGLNSLSERKKRGFVDVLLKEIREPMIVLLVVIGIIYSVLGNPSDAITIVVIVLIVVFLEVASIHRAGKSIQALKSLSSHSSVVIRNSSPVIVKSSTLVPGDIVILSPGDRIPADGRLTDSYNLKVDESSLTGESFPVGKSYSSDIVEGVNARPNLVFSGTLIVHGSGKMVVTGTGRNTELGKISGLVEEAEEAPTPLEESMSRLSYILAMVALAFSVAIPVIGYFEHQPLDTMIVTGLSLAFATLPEELPIVISVTLAAGAYALAKKNAIVRELRAAETLGNVTIIATDKTGTITENRMSIGHTFTLGNMLEGNDAPDPELLKSALLGTGNLESSSKSAVRYKDPMEVAVLQYSEGRAEIDDLRKDYEVLEEFGFDDTSKTSSFVYKSDGTDYIYVTGAPEKILSFTDIVYEKGTLRQITDEDRTSIMSAVDSLSEKGERIIGVAYRRGIDPSREKKDLERHLTLVGLVSFVDPPRSDVKSAIEQCQKAGIRVIMITGDLPKTAREIANSVGINHSSNVILGSELAQMSEEEFENAMKDASIFARITPEDKYRIVKYLASSGEVVAVTGDGVNDSPALKTADIGISMGIRGTDAAKESSDMILTDDKFSTIVDAVREGKNIFFTLRKGVRYYLSVKLALVMVFIVPLFLSIPFPFSPIQIIVVELFVDVAALAGFVSERGERGLMDSKPAKRGKQFIDRSMTWGVALGAIGLFVGVTTIYLYTYFNTGSLVEAQTAAFSTWVISQVLLAQNLRTENEPLLSKGFFANRAILLWGLGVIMALAVITLFPDLQVILSTAYLTALDWALIVVVSILSTFWIEVVKIVRVWQGRSKRDTNLPS